MEQRDRLSTGGQTQCERNSLCHALIILKLAKSYAHDYYTWGLVTPSATGVHNNACIIL